MSDQVANIRTLTLEEKRALIQKLSKENTREWPLSHGQQALWLLQQQAPHSCAYNVAACLEICGELNLEYLYQALKILVERHPTLRSKVAVKGNEPKQVFSNKPDFTWQVEPLVLDEGETVEQAVYAAYAKPFSLENGPVTRAQVFALDKQHHLFLLCVHHIAIDGLSLWQLLDEMQKVYSDLMADRYPALPKIAATYLDFIINQRNLLSSEAGRKQLSYWQEELSGELPVLQLRTDKVRPPLQKFNGAGMATHFPPEFAVEYLSFCRAQGVTPFVLGLSLFATLLHRYSRQDDLLIATPSAGSNPDLYQGVVGYFVNPLPIRVQLDAESSFAQCLQATDKKIKLALANQDIPFPVLVDKLKVRRDASSPVLCQSLFVYQKQPSGNNRVGFSDKFYQWGKLQAKHFPLDQQAGQFDIALEILEDDGELAAHWKYNSDIFCAETIHRMANAFVHLSKAIFANPNELLSRFSLLPDAARPILMQPPRQQFAVEHSIAESFANSATTFAERLAVRSPERDLRYAELHELSDKLASYLLMRGAEPQQPIGIALPRSCDLLVAILGVLKAGCFYIPLDPNYPIDRLQHMLADSGTEWLLTHSQSSELADNLCQSAQHRLHTILVDQLDLALVPRRTLPLVDSESLAYMLYTSGSTGKPKGVKVTHANVMRLFHATQTVYQFNEQDVWTLFHSYAFDFTVWEIWGALLFGGKLVVVPFDVSRSPQEFHQLLVREKVTVLSQTPSAFQQVQRIDLQTDIKALQHLRWVVFGGEALNLQSLKPWFEKYGDQQPRLVNMYGITETTVHVTYRVLSVADTEIPQSLIGEPLADLHLLVLDSALQPVPIGVPGEIFVGGAGVSRGYHQRDELNAERFLANPVLIGEKLYRTGDLGCWTEDLTIAYLGRIDNQIQLRGFRIELGEIENQLSTHPVVSECLVLLREDRQGDQRLVAYFTLQANASTHASRASVSWAHLRDYLRVQLPDYMVPSTGVLLEEFPLTVNGKIDRGALPKPEYKSDQDIVRPRDTLEQQMACLWQEVLDLPQVGIEDNFFEIGGHSLLAAKLVDRIQTQLHYELSLATLLQKPTIAQLCDDLRNGNSDVEWSPLVVLQSRGEQTPLFLVPGGTGNALYYQPLAASLAQLEGNSRPIYGLSAVGLDGESAPLNTIAEIAEVNIAAMRSVQPEGPYLISGHCFGGLIAYEMANQLVALGETVARLVLLDIPAPLPEHRPPSNHWQDSDWLVYFINVITESTGTPPEFPLSLLATVSAEQQLQLCQRYLENVGVVPSANNTKAAQGLLNVFKCYSNIAYRPSHKTPLPISLIRAAEFHPAFDYAAADDAGSAEKSSLGWRQVADSSLAINTVPGNHISMLLAPHVAGLANVLRASLVTECSTNSHAEITTDSKVVA